MTHILRSKAEQAISLAKYLPGGRLFKQAFINTSNLHKFLKGLASELVLADGYIRTYESEILPDQTVLFLDEWERAVGIPDDCFPGTGTQDERRTHILVKLASLGVQTQQDFIDLAALFGVSVTIESATDEESFPLTLPFTLITETAARFTIIVKFTTTAANAFPLTFSIVFGDPTIGILECLFKKLKPANCDIKFIEV